MRTSALVKYLFSVNPSCTFSDAKGGLRMEHPQVVYAPESALSSEPHVICLEPHWLQKATKEKPSFLGFFAPTFRV